MTIRDDFNEERLRSGPSLPCTRVERVDSHTLEGVQVAFPSSVSCSLQQSWQNEPSRAFAPVSIRVACSDHELLVHAELTDVEIYTDASGLNQRLRELGDSLEIFLCEDREEAYVELQVAPNNQRLQRRCEKLAAPEPARSHNDLESGLIRGEAFRSREWIGKGVWKVFAAIPAGLVCDDRTRLPGSCWRYSFSRYEYACGTEESVISPPRTRVDSHRKDGGA
jgi:hypothetical protein